MKYSVILPHGPLNELTGIKDPVEAYEMMTNVAQVAEEVGFNAIWLSDVFWGGQIADASQAEHSFLFESWTTTAALARDTKRVRIGQVVTYSGLRNPALLAKMASTVDVMSNGRLTLGIGSGSPTLETQFRAYGYDYPDIPTRSRQLREAIQILRAMWTEPEATFEGQYYQIHGAINSPKGVQQPHIPILIGGNGEQVTLKLVAQYGAACNVFGNPATIEKKLAVLQAHCEATGKDYQSINRTAGTILIMEESDEQAQAKLPHPMWAGAGLVGSPETIRKQIAAFEQAGIQELLLRFPGTSVGETTPGAIRRFAREFIA